MEKIIVTAANGFMGSHLIEFFKHRFEVVALVRKPQEPRDGVKWMIWDGKTLGKWQQEFEGAKCIINLAGKSVDCRYNEKNKKEIYASRLESTQVIGEAIDLCERRPEVWINAASATIYRHEEDNANTERDGIIGEGFSVDVCQQWERTFFEFTYPNLRQVAIRTAIVLGNDGGAFVPLKRLAMIGMGGKQGNGRQMFSWIHIHDFCRAIEWIINNETLEGPVNLAAPNPVQNNEVMRTIRKVFGVPFGLPLPAALLNIGARFINTETELVLKSRFVIPEKLDESQFKFQYETIDQAINHLKQSK